MCAIMGFSTKKLDKHEIWEYFDRTLSRGPDMSKIMDTGSGWLCFHRLAIMGLTEAGMQPFELDGDMVVCNGGAVRLPSPEAAADGEGLRIQERQRLRDHSAAVPGVRPRYVRQAERRVCHDYL